MSSHAGGAPAPVFTIDDVVRRYVETRDEIGRIAERHAAELAPFNKRLEVMESWLLRQLNDSHADSVRTEHGTAYRSTVMSATVDPDGGWDRLADHIIMAALDAAADVMEKNGTPEEAVAAFRNVRAFALLNRSVNKTAVKEIVDDTGTPPPGVKITHVTKVNVRRV